MSRNKLILLAASLLIVTSWGCGSNMESGGDQTGGDTTLANAATKGISNCLTCHNPDTASVQAWMGSRHGNRLNEVGKNLLRDTDDIEDHVHATPGTNDDPRPGSCDHCHDPYDDGSDIDLTYIQTANQPANTDWSLTGSIVGCEACHGGGQYHNGIPAGIPYAVPGPYQCGQCHYLNDTIANQDWVLEGEYPHHDTNSGGANVWRNISDSHIDNPATSYVSSELDAADPLFAANIVEGYVVRQGEQNGCVECHFNGHAFDLSKNFEWAKSGHAGAIKTLKNVAVADGAADAATLLANVTAAGPDDTETFPHYDWDNSDADLDLGSDRSSCQMCHTATGAMNFLTDPANYNAANNDFSHLEGWTVDHKQSGQNELLYCWGCHSNSTGALRNPGAIPLSYTYNDVGIILPTVGTSNVCVNCHSGRGNNDTIRTARSSRGGAVQHHAPTAGSVFASVTHSGFEFDTLSYVNAAFKHASINTSTSGPCVTCHMGTSDQNHTFSAVVYTSGAITHQATTDAIATVRQLASCNVASCHDGAASAVMAAASLQTQKVGFEAARTILELYVKNTTANYLGLNINTTSIGLTVEINAYGSWQNYKYMVEDPCAYVHNAVYARRLIFDSIDWMQDGDLDGTIDITGLTNAALAADWLVSGSAVGSVARP